MSLPIPFSCPCITNNSNIHYVICGEFRFSLEVKTSGSYNLLLNTRVNHFVFSLEIMATAVTFLVDIFNAL